MPLRRKFLALDRASFQVGVTVEWLNGTVWHAGEVTGSVEKDEDGREFHRVCHRGPTTRTVSRGETVRGYPGHVRMPQAEESTLAPCSAHGGLDECHGLSRATREGM